MPLPYTVEDRLDRLQWGLRFLAKSADAFATSEDQDLGQDGFYGLSEFCDTLLDHVTTLKAVLPTEAQGLYAPDDGEPQQDEDEEIPTR
jgi:hypothetical protein